MIGDRYALDREIGRGGMGAVWLGRDEVLGRPVAVKRVGVAPDGSSPDLLRAEREARIAASLNHPNIVGVFDLVQDRDQQWLVMEYVEGTTFAALVRERGALAPEDAAPFLAQAASALAAAHENHVVHRDVKPSNILVREDGHVKLSDFGIARAEADASLTQTGLVTGSPAYLAPEVASGQVATPASDVWSLGATLFHALAGRTPYEVGDNVLGALYRIVHEPPPRLPDAGVLAPVLEGTMVHDPASRWSMADVARYLEQVVEGQAPVPPHVTGASVADLADEQGTRVLTQHVPASPPPPAPDPEPARPVTPAPTPTPARASSPPPAPGRRSTSGGRRRVLPLAVGGLVVALVVAIVVLLQIDDPQDMGLPEDGASSSTSAGTPSSSPSPTDTPSTPAPPTAEDLEAFAESYVQTASSDPSAGFTMLTPDYQARSPSYEEFWGGVTNPRILSVEADPEALTVTYVYRYNYPGDGNLTEEVTLYLVRDGDGFLIDDAS